MDMRRLKTIFIFVLIAINVMFFAILHNARNYEREEKRTMTKSISMLLSENMIYLSEKAELPASPQIHNFYLEKMFGSNEELVLKFLGNDYALTAESKYESDEGVLYIDGDEFRFVKNTPCGAVEDFSEENIEKVCREEMQHYGIMSDLYVFGGFNFVDNGVRAIFTVQHDENIFFDAYISFDIFENGLGGIAGKNLLSDLIDTDSRNDFCSIISILPDLAENPTLESNTSHTVVSITSGYYIGKTAESYRNILAIPVWQIATDTGQILYYDARNGQRVE